jgi:hypothetical protein
LDHTGSVRRALGEALARQGKSVEAIAALQRAIAVGERADGPKHPAVIASRLSLVECLLAAQHDTEARTVLATTPTSALADLPTVHPIVAQWDRVTGLLAQRDHETAAARAWLGKSYEMYKALYGPRDWRTLRADEERLRLQH